MFNKPAAKNGTNRGGNSREPRPGADRLTSACLVERGTDDRKTAGHEKRCSHALNTPRDYQLMDVRGDSAAGRSNGENCHACDKYLAPAEQVAEQDADQNQ